MSAPIADRSSLRSAGIAAIALALGFSAILHPAAQDLFQRLAGLLARLAEAGLSLSTFEVMRNGTELRNAVTGFAVDVTRACDGHGILICWAAVLLVLPGRWQARLLAFAAGFVAIQAFNLVRVVVLFAASPAGSPLFDTLHYFAFPLATSALILALAAWRQPHLRWPAVLAVAALCVAAPVWFFLSGPLGAALLVPAANAVLAMTAPPEIGSIALRAAGWTVSSDLIQTTQPLRLYLAPQYPGDFALALPALAQDAEPATEMASDKASYGGEKGPDMSLEAMTPEDEAVNVGLAGQDPSNIARYLLASGAGGTSLSPDGETLAMSWDITGEPQLWTFPASGGQPQQLTFGNGVF